MVLSVVVDEVPSQVLVLFYVGASLIGDRKMLLGHADTGREETHTHSLTTNERECDSGGYTRLHSHSKNQDVTLLSPRRIYTTQDLGMCAGDVPTRSAEETRMPETDTGNVKEFHSSRPAGASPPLVFKDPQRGRMFLMRPGTRGPRFEVSCCSTVLA